MKYFDLIFDFFLEFNNVELSERNIVLHFALNAADINKHVNSEVVLTYDVCLARTYDFLRPFILCCMQFGHKGLIYIFKEGVYICSIKQLKIRNAVSGYIKNIRQR